MRNVSFIVLHVQYVKSAVHVRVCSVFQPDVEAKSAKRKSDSKGLFDHYKCVALNVLVSEHLEYY